MIELPYGIADFRSIRRDGMVYVDRTGFIRELERLGRVLVFLRPRRFGKSLWLQTLANYYDLRRIDEFDELFGGLEVGHRPTPLAHRYFVLQWNFSNVDPSGGVEQITESLHRHVSYQVEAFASDYEGHLGAPVKFDDRPDAVLASLLSVVRKTPYKLYLLIDEYDNFVNEVMAKDVDTYHALFENDGPFKQLFKSVKNATEGFGLERIFVTGVSPIALNDLTSGFNIAKDVSLVPEMATLCGFREAEVGHLLEDIAGERDLPAASVAAALAAMRTWYNGYRFVEGTAEDLGTAGDELVYNPTNTLYFLEYLQRRGTPPPRLHDENLRTDRGKLAFLARSSAGAGVIERLTEGDGEIDASRLLTSFSIDDLTRRMGKDPDVVTSFLYYMGLLTLAEGSSTRLRIPNLVVQKLFLDRLLEIYLPDPGDSYQARNVAMKFLRDGDLEPLLGFFEEKLLPVFSNRDRGFPPRKPGQSGSGVNETTVKTLFLSMLFDDTRYVTHSEPEIDRGYADLCLLVRPEMRRRGFLDHLFEFKLVRRERLAESGREIRGMDAAQLRRVPAVAQAVAAARDQVERYRAALLKREGALDLRAYVVVAVGLERLLGEKVEGSRAASSPA